MLKKMEKKTRRYPTLSVGCPMNDVAYMQGTTCPWLELLEPYDDQSNFHIGNNRMPQQGNDEEEGFYYTPLTDEKISQEFNTRHLYRSTFVEDYAYTVQHHDLFNSEYSQGSTQRNKSILDTNKHLPLKQDKLTKSVFSNEQHTPVYISVTSTFKNQDILEQTLQSIMKQTRLPDKIFVYLSEDAYLLDSGFKDRKITNLNLLKTLSLNSIINVKWVKNIGSYRKLLPLLKEKWREDCFIITIDDDTIYDSHLIENLILFPFSFKFIKSFSSE